MEDNFECRYVSIGGTYCFHYDEEIVDDLGNNECNDCDMNKSCKYCHWGLAKMQDICKDCKNQIIR